MISVIVPAYNSESTIIRCVDSLCQQTIHDMEIIVVDDGSTDTTLENVNRLAKLDDRIVIIHKDNGGVSSARNYGLKIASGEFISFIDSDDYTHPEMFEKLLTAIEKTKSDVAVCNYFHESAGGGTA